MEQYILKSALVARIKKLKMDIGNIFNEYDEGFWKGRTTAFDDVICALDTLEVKEVDLEKEIGKYLDTNDIEFGYQIKLVDFAKHFFELGMAVSNKAQKGK